MLILEGKNKFYLNRNLLKIKDIDKILALKNNDEEKNLHIFNSQIFISQRISQRILNNFEIDLFFGFYSDVFKKISVIECLIEANQT